MLVFIDMKIFPNNMAFPSLTSILVEYLSKVEVVSPDCPAQLKSPCKLYFRNTFSWKIKCQECKRAVLSKLDISIGSALAWGAGDLRYECNPCFRLRMRNDDVALKLFPNVLNFLFAPIEYQK